MTKNNEEKLTKIILWKEILIMPLYTILFNYFRNIFWIILIGDRLIGIILSKKSIKIDEYMEKALEGENKKIYELMIFVLISGITLYILIFMKHRQLFNILIIAEIIDFIIMKFL